MTIVDITLFVEIYESDSYGGLRLCTCVLDRGATKFEVLQHDFGVLQHNFGVPQHDFQVLQHDFEVSVLQIFLTEQY
ncbi:MAG: hypothetical protein V7K53_07820 [Nostoc sp.]|uniref:hypothetical protein n=1 Tax=Nostoc sp. TaxID=1180 RepID=UPI002FF549E5